MAERFGVLLARLRREQGLSQDRLAQLLNDNAGNATCSRHEVSRWENERDGRLPSAYWLRSIAAALEVDLRTLERAAVVSRGTHDHETVVAVASPVVTNEGPGAVETWEIVDALTRSSIDASALDAMESAVFEYAASYPVTGPDGMLAATERQMARLGEALTQPMPVAVRRRAVSLLALLAGIVGHQYLDLGSSARSSQLLRLGRLASAEAENADLSAWVIATESIAAFYDDRSRDAVDLLAESDTLAMQGSSRRRRAWIAAMRARALAASDDALGSHHALEDAHRLLEGRLDPPMGNDFFNHARLDGIAGSTMLMLGETPRATALIGQALDTRGQADVKGRALLMLDLANCRIADDEPAEATQLVGHALDIAGSSMVRPIAAKAMTVRANMTPWGTTRMVADVDERLAAALPQTRKTT